LVWKVYTVVRPLHSLSRQVSLTVPLIAGERPVTEGLTSRDGQVLLNFGPNSSAREWESDLTVNLDEPLVLKAGQGSWSEAWSLDASSIWRVETSGLTPILSVDPSGFWNPQWRPWPGESLSVEVSRPEPVPGAYVASDSSSLTLTLGRENRRGELNFNVRTSQGGPMSFRLPPGAEIQSLSLDDQSLPFGVARLGSKDSEAPEAVLPLNPGSHDVFVSWLEPLPISALVRTPSIDLGVPAANVNLNIQTPEDRWTIWAGGPTKGPAVRFWARALGFLILAWALSRLRLAPLGTLSWLLLFLGLSQLSVFGSMLVAGWLLALGWRARRRPVKSRFLFDIVQLGLMAWTVVALCLIYGGLRHALLAAPSMSVIGNGSSDHLMAWFVDRAIGPWPTGFVLTIPAKAYQYVMLAWALWLAYYLIARWLRWGWSCFSQDGFWRKKPPKPPRRPSGSGPAATAESTSGETPPEADRSAAVDSAPGS
jgi:hypothetical protein